MNSDPAMPGRALDCDPFLRLDGEQPPHKVLRVLGYVVPVRRREGEGSRSDALVNGTDLAALVVEWREAAEQDVRDHANAPHVDLANAFEVEVETKVELFGVCWGGGGGRG